MAEQVCGPFMSPQGVGNLAATALSCSRMGCLQVNGVKEVSDYVAKLRRVGKGLGVYQFDQASWPCYVILCSCTCPDLGLPDSYWNTHVCLAGDRTASTFHGRRGCCDHRPISLG